MKKIKWIIAVIAIIIGTVLYIAYNSQIPDLNLTYNGSKIEVLKCPFGWDSGLKSFRADYPTPDVLAKNMNSVLAKSESLLDLSFSRKPQKVEVSLWDKQSKPYNYDHGKIILPKDKGEYIFGVIGYWQQGEVLYVFKVKVE